MKAVKQKLLSVTPPPGNAFHKTKAIHFIKAKDFDTFLNFKF